MFSKITHKNDQGRHIITQIRINGVKKEKLESEGF